MMKTLSPELIEKTLSSLKKNGMEALYYPGRTEAKEEVLKRIPPMAKVGIGGSVTLREMGLLDELRRRGNVLFDHWREGLSKEERFEVGLKQQSSEIFLTSTNALTQDGKLINVDATGNRVTSMIFGPPRVIVVTGINKIVKDIHEGLDRIKRVVAPRNCQRRKDPTPCAIDLVCHDCSSPGRLCRITTIIERRPFATKEFVVILVGEELGY
jgi:L-lactate utilization protein LutB